MLTFFFFFSLQRTEGKTDQEMSSSEKKLEEQQEEAKKKVVQETVTVEERHVMNVHASGDAAKIAGILLDATAQAASHVASSIKGKEGSAVMTEGVKEETREDVDKAVTKQEETATVSHEQEEQQSATAHVLEPLFEVIKNF